MASRALVSAIWGASRASNSLSTAAAAWMLSGLTPSPLINGLLPAATALPLLLGLPSRPRLGTGLQLLAGALLLAIAARQVPLPVAATLAAMLLLTLGVQLADLPLQRRFSEDDGVPMTALRTTAEAGRLLGSLLAGVLFPIGKALLQFSQAIVLLLPLVALTARPPSGMGPGPTAGQTRQGWGAAAGRLDEAPLLQGLLFGSLFGLVPLWVRQQGAGNCFDFAMVLTAYGIGRTSAEALRGRVPLGPATPYTLLAALLAATQLLPDWGAVLLFLPMGWLAAAADLRLIDSLNPAADPALRLQRFGRSACLGGMAGSVAMGLAGELLGLGGVLPLQLLAFLAAAAGLPRLVPPR